MIILSISPVVIDSQTPSIPSRFGNISTGSKYPYTSTLAHVSAILLHLRQPCKSHCKLFIGRNIVCHLSIVKLLICNHIKIAGSGKSKNDSLFFSGFFTFQRLVNGNTNRMRTLRGPEGFPLFLQTALLLQIQKSALHSLPPSVRHHKAVTELNSCRDSEVLRHGLQME